MGRLLEISIWKTNEPPMLYEMHVERERILIEQTSCLLPSQIHLDKNATCETVNSKWTACHMLELVTLPRPGFEPGSPRPQRGILTTILPWLETRLIDDFLNDIILMTSRTKIAFILKTTGAKWFSRLPGVEPGIFWSVVRRVVHCATTPSDY